MEPEKHSSQSMTQNKASSFLRRRTLPRALIPPNRINDLTHLTEKTVRRDKKSRQVEKKTPRLNPMNSSANIFEPSLNQTNISAKLKAMDKSLIAATKQESPERRDRKSRIDRISRRTYVTETSGF